MTTSTVSNPMSGQFADGATARTFLLAGNARITVVSERTGARFTFRVSTPKQGRPGQAKPHFVAVLTGANNETDYEFFGTVFEATKFVASSRSRISKDAPSAKAWAWAWEALSKGELPKSCQVFHEGRCGRCGRCLTVPESVASGFGPECITKMAG